MRMRMHIVRGALGAAPVVQELIALEGYVLPTGHRHAPPATLTGPQRAIGTANALGTLAGAARANPGSNRCVAKA